MPPKYQKLALIGSGSFGKAWLVTQVKNPVKMVSKEITITKLTEKESEQCLTEVMVLARCKHGNIIRYIDAYVENRCLNIVMEYADGGDLQRKIFKQNGIYFAKEVILEWFTQIMMALEYIHKRNILHRDLKSQNVFLTGNDIIKLGDFGIAKILQNQDDHAMTTIGTPFYISPEICQKKPYNSSSDMWAAGCLLYEMCLLRVPFNAPDFTSLVLKILQGNYDPIPSNHTKAANKDTEPLIHLQGDHIPEILCRAAIEIIDRQIFNLGYFGPLIQHLVSSLVVNQPSSRLSASEVLNMSQMAGFVKKIHSKHCELYKGQRSRSGHSNNRLSKCQRSGSPGCDAENLPERVTPDITVQKGVSKDITDRNPSNDEVKISNIPDRDKEGFNKMAQYSQRQARGRIKSVHNVRSITPDLRKSHKVERQHSEPRRYSFSDIEPKRNADQKQENIDRYDSKLIEDKGKGKSDTQESYNSCTEKENSSSNKDQAICDNVAMLEVNDMTPKKCCRNIDKGSSAAKKTYMIRESALRRLSQASPLLSETVRQQRASLSVDTSDIVAEPPRAALFGKNDRAPHIDSKVLAENNVLDSSEDDVFDNQELNSREFEFPAGGLESRDRQASWRDAQIMEYETGPFDIEPKRKKVDSSTYIVKSAAFPVNNNAYAEGKPDINEILFLAASVNKSNHKLARDTLYDAAVSHLGPVKARNVVSMVTKYLEVGQSYQSLISILSEEEMDILPILLCIYNTSV